MIEDLNADAVYARRIQSFTEQDKKKFIDLSKNGYQIKVIGI